MLPCLLAATWVGAGLQADSIKEVNVALAAWGYSSATASSVYGPGYEADKALDGAWKSREQNKWNSAEGAGPKWLEVDLGHSFSIDNVVVRHEGVYADGKLYDTSDFEIQRGETANGPWTDLAAPVKDNHEDVSTIRFPATACRFLRLYITKGEQGRNGFGRIFEFEAYAPKATIDVPMLRLSWPEMPQFRHKNGKLDEAASVTALKGKADRFLVDGKTQPVENGLLWLPVNGQPAEVSMAGQRPRWSLADDRTWLLDLAGGRIDLVSSSHQDVAWMDTPEWCREHRVDQILVPAIEMMERDPRYCFTMENMLNLVELLQRRPDLRSEIGKLVDEGRLEFGGTYNQPYESLLGGEQLIRQVYFGRRWLRKQFPGRDTDFAFSVDVPGRSLQMQQILAKAGIRYFVTSRYHQGLFRWYSPDGSSILVYAHDHYGNYSGTIKEKPTEAERDLPAMLAPFAKDFAEHSIPPVFMALNSQDFEAPVDFGPLIDHWSKQGLIATMDGKPVDAPALAYSSTKALFKSLDQPGSKPRKLEGERPNMWLYIHGPTHCDSIHDQREAARLLPVAETFATFRALVEGSFVTYPQQRLADGWLATLYPDHGFGGKNGHITDAVFRSKYLVGLDAARSTLHDSLEAITGHIKTSTSKGVPVVVFNPHSWSRNDVVTASLPDASRNWIVKSESGQTVPSQIDTGSDLIDVATSAEGARVLQATGKGGGNLIAERWWDPRRGWWESAMPASFTIDLGQDRPVRRILLRHCGVYGEFQKEVKLNTRGFRLLASRSAIGPWSEVAPEVKSNAQPISVFEFPPRPVRYVKVEVTDPNQGADQVARLVGIDVFASVSRRPMLSFSASGVPSLGYRTYYLRRAASSPTQEEGTSAIENAFYRIKLVPGGIGSLVDKQTGVEVFRPSTMVPGEVFTMRSVGNGAGEFGAAQQPAMAGFDRISAHRAQWRRVPDQSGPVFATYELVQEMGGAKVRQTLVIYNRIKRIDFDVDLDGWVGTKYREFRLAFPVGGPKAQVSYEVPMGTVRIGQDEIKTTGGHAYGSLTYWQECKDIHPREVQDGIQVRDGGNVTTISSGVSVFDFVDPTGMAGPGPFIQPILLASRKSCHGEGNWYTQPGDHHFHFSLTSGRDSRAGYRDAADAQNGLMAVVGAAASSRRILPEKLSFASVTMPDVRISTIKKAEDDDSVIVRCYEAEGGNAAGSLRLFEPIRTARLCDIIEDEKGPMPVSGGSAPIRVGHWSIETYKLRPGSPRFR